MEEAAVRDRTEFLPSWGRGGRCRASISSASSCHSDSDTERMCNCEEVAQDPDPAQGEDKLEAEYTRQRSLSDAGSPVSSDEFEVFPSLPKSVLEKLGLRGNVTGDEGPTGRLSDDEVEQKFASLSLAFSIDAATVEERCERQRRRRDQTEANLAAELGRLGQRAGGVRRLCVDAETTELLAALLAQIEAVGGAARLAHAAAERYGAAQLERRLSDGVQLMLGHVAVLRQQRDSARRQLQYTKKMLQDNSEHLGKVQHRTVVPNDRIITRRRASIATFNQAQESPKREYMKTNRRPSELNFRSLSSVRNGRPARLELGLDLVKIKEGSIELDQVPQENCNDQDTNHLGNNCNSQDIEKEIPDTSFRGQLYWRFTKFLRTSRVKFKEWTEDGTWHEICCFCALACFSLSLITMTSILLEYEMAKRDVNPSKLFWFLSTGDDQEITRTLLEKQQHKLASSGYT